MKKLLILCILLTGCGNSIDITKEVLTTEGFIAVAVAQQTKTEAKKVEAVKAVEEEVKVEVKQENIPEQAIKIKTPSKYLRLFSAEAGCGPCIHQEQILMGSDWIIKNGAEEDNQSDIKYHGLKQTVPNLNSGNDQLWQKYKAKSVPFWQLIENGKVVKTHSGVLTLNELRDFYLNLKKTDKPSSNCTCEDCKCGPNCQCE